MVMVTSAVPGTITYEGFRDLIANRARRLLGLSDLLVRSGPAGLVLTRPLLGELMSQSMQIEELLDSYDAHNNRRWSTFRSMIAAIKLFSDLAYELLHIEHALPAYRLLPIERNFAQATGETLHFVRDILCGAAARLIQQAQHLELPITPVNGCEKDFSEQMPDGRLPRDRTARDVKSQREKVTLLATAFLNLASVTKLADDSCSWSDEPTATQPASFTEENLRTLQLRFHNLQSLYDTYVSETGTEGRDADLPVLRGHISVVFHLLKTATSFAHYYERHLNCPICGHSQPDELVVQPQQLLNTMMNYSIAYAGQYVRCARRLCQTMLRRYTEDGCIEVPMPKYRGFHVRPATLIARLVLHYGSKVQMDLEGQVYDAASPLELFRANEQINARKRRWLAAEVAKLDLAEYEKNSHDVMAVVRTVIMKLAERSRLILYEQPLKLPAEPASSDRILLTRVTDEIARLQAMGIIDIDIESDLKVTFTGDKRVLEDIRLLAESGYGEDNFGNNTPLPEELAYLRQ